MRLDYSVKMPDEEEAQTISADDDRKSLMTRSSMQATYLSAVQPLGGGAQPAPTQPSKQGWGQTQG